MQYFLPPWITPTKLLMKKLFCLLLVCLTTLSVQAQSRYSSSVEIVTGVGVVWGPLATLTSQYVAQFDLGNGFMAGAGAGTRFSLPCSQHITSNGNSRRNFCLEADVPVFLRFGYGIGRFFANADAGNAIGLLSIYGAGRTRNGNVVHCYDGLFFEPQIGWKLGRKGALSLGVLLQRSTVMEHIETRTADAIYEEVHQRNLFTPAINLRYCIHF